jgi:hypothetical protein
MTHVHSFWLHRVREVFLTCILLQEQIDCYLAVTKEGNPDLMYYINTVSRVEGNVYYLNSI